MRASPTKGFTIVELIIVITVIGVLAAVTMVGYNSIQAGARDKAVISDVEAVESEISRYAVKNGGTFGDAVEWYSGGSANANILFTPSQGNLIDVVASTTEYCIRAYNPAASTYKSLATAYQKGSSSGACDLLGPSSEASSE